MHVSGYMRTFGARVDGVHANHTSPDLLSNVIIRCCNAPAPLHRLTDMAMRSSHALGVGIFSHSVSPTIRGTVVTSSLNLGPGSTNDSVHIPLPPLARRHHGSLAGVIHNRTRRTHITMHGIHHSTGSGIGTLLGSGRVDRSSSHHSRSSMRGLASTTVGGVRTTLTSGRTRLVRF